MLILQLDVALLYLHIEGGKKSDKEQLWLLSSLRQFLGISPLTPRNCQLRRWNYRYMGMLLMTNGSMTTAFPASDGEHAYNAVQLASDDEELAREDRGVHDLTRRITICLCCQANLLF